MRFKKRRWRIHTRYNGEDSYMEFRPVEDSLRQRWWHVAQFWDYVNDVNEYLWDLGAIQSIGAPCPYPTRIGAWLRVKLTALVFAVFTLAGIRPPIDWWLMTSYFDGDK